MNIKAVLCFVCVLVGTSGNALAAITDLTEWTRVVDPFDPSFSGSATATTATLLAADGVVPVATDIGYQSVNGQTAATSSSGYFFKPSSNFALAVDYGVSFTGSPSGVLALGFGIGEDSDGMDSAGGGFSFVDGVPFLVFGGAARVNDMNQLPVALPLAATMTGSLFVAYDAATGSVVIGASQSQGAVAPTLTDEFAGIQNQWNDQDLVASFFVRSAEVPPFAPVGTLAGWNGGGTAEVQFSNVRVLAGTPMALAIPEPSAAALFGAASIAWMVRTRRSRRSRATLQISVAQTRCEKTRPSTRKKRVALNSLPV